MAEETKQETEAPRAAKPPKPPKDQKGGGKGKGKDAEHAA